MATSSKPGRLVWLFFALALGGFALGTTEFAAMSLVPFIAHEFGVTQPEAGRAISAYALGVVLGAPILMVMSVRFRQRPTLMVLLTAIGIGNGLSALAPTYSSYLVFRFISGIPHGAYFGIAMIFATSLVPSGQRAQAVSKVFMGLTIATIIGVPFAVILGQTAGWRWGLGLVAAVAFVAVGLVRMTAPNPPVQEGLSPTAEFSALRISQVWLTLGIAVIGFGGIFCVYTYLATTLLEVTHASAGTIMLVMAVFGVGSTIGNIFYSRMADKSTLRAALIALLATAVTLSVFPSTVGNIWVLSVAVFFIGTGLGLASILQARLMEVAAHAQSMAGALLQCALNLANAIGPWVGGLVITGGYGVESTGYAAACLTLGGIAMWLLTVFSLKRGGSIRLRAQELEPLD